jgi:glycosyltransferase involved in cell wall biosynthesis
MAKDDAVGAPLCILFVLSELESAWRGGIGRVAVGMACALAARENEVHMAGRTPNRESPAIEGVEMHVWPPRRPKVAQLPPLIRLQQQIEADVVHFHSALPHGAVMLPLLAFRRRLGAPRVVVTPYTGARADYRKRLARAALARVDAVVANSRWGAERAIAAGAPSQRSWVIPAGIDAVEQHDAGLRRSQVAVLARLVRSKGVNVLLEAFDRAAASRPSWRLCIAGEGREEAALRARAAALHCAARIDFLGVVEGEAKARLLVETGIGVVPSRDDNFPGALLELLAHGIPCIASRVGGIPEIANGGRAARLTEPGSVQDLAEALAELMASSERRAALAEEALAISAERTWPRLAERLESLYRELGA